MIKSTDVILITGRFSILHTGHCSLISQALQSSTTGVVINFGSCQESRTLKNPFTPNERMEMMAQFFEDDVVANRLLFTAVDDTPDTKSWVHSVYKESAKACKEAWKLKLSHQHTSYCVWTSGKGEDGTLRQDWFASLCPVKVVKPLCHDIHATHLRELYFKTGVVEHDHLPETTSKFLLDFKEDPCYSMLRKLYLNIPLEG